VLGVETEEVDDAVEPAESVSDGVSATPSRPSARQSSKQLRGDAALVHLLRGAVAAASDDDGWANLGAVGSTAAKQSPDFDSRNWGYAKLIDLVTTMGLFEVRRPAKGASGGAVEIRQLKKGS
jgi:hypothetical protein